MKTAATMCSTVLALLAGALLAAPAEAASPAWRVLGVTGPTNMAPYTSEKQTISPIFTASAYTLTFDGDTTTTLARDAPASDVEAALNALPSINGGGGSVSVIAGPTGTTGTSYVVTFDGGPLAGTDVPLMTASGSGVSVAVTLSGILAVYPTNIGGAATSGPVTVTVGPLPAGITTAGTATGDGWSCLPAGGGQSTVTCTSSDPVPDRENANIVQVPLIVGAGAAASSSVRVSVAGGGAAPEMSGIHDVVLTVSPVHAEAGVQAFWAGAFDADGHPYTQAGGHPYSAGSVFLLNSRALPSGEVTPAGDLRDAIVDLPPGFVGNPMVTQRCPRNQPAPPTVPGTEHVCHSDSYVGIAGPITQKFPVRPDPGGVSPIVNHLPPRGSAAAFTFPVIFAKQTVLASLRSESDFGVTATAPNVLPVYKLYGATFILHGNPAGAAGKAFLTNPTDCSGQTLPTLIRVDAWHQPGVFSGTSDDSPPTTGCELVPFEPATSVAPTSTAPDSASGLDVDFTLPQEGLLDPNAIATSHLKKAVVQLPEGFSVNPSAATGLQGCSDEQIAVHSTTAPQCPDESKLGTVQVTSPLIDQALDGVMYLGTPKSTDPQSGEMFRLFLSVRNGELGLSVKLAGSAVADPQTGRLTATFDNNPRVPFDHLSVKLKSGPRGVLATSQACGPVASSTTLSPWSGNAPAIGTTPTDVTGDCTFGFSPTLTAGMDSQKARGSGTFSFELARPQGDQTLSGLTATLPKGLLASVKDVPLCADAQAAAGSCPASSKIGIVDAKAGSGDPFILEEKGEVFLTEGYKGGAYGLAVKIRPVAGPFRGDMELSPIIVRQAIHVDRTTAQVTAVSDPFPQIHHGVPLRVREVTVLVNRGGFMLNPSDCADKQVGASIVSVQGTVADRSVPFHAAGCASLPFKPTLALALTGKKQVTTGKHPGIKATVTQQGVGEAGIEKAEVRLPKSLALDPENAQALCEFEDGTKPDLENRCPKGSIVGRARAKTPLLRDDLAGNVYFVKNVRIDPETGNQIRTLPMIIVALRGEIAVNLKGESSTTKSGKLVNTFASVPDAPISRFNLNINGGKTGIIAVTRTRKARINLCTGRHIAETDMDGQNGRRHDTDVRMKTPCTKRQTKVAKRHAKRAAAKARAGSKRG